MDNQTFTTKEPNPAPQKRNGIKPWIFIVSCVASFLLGIAAVLAFAFAFGDKDTGTEDMYYEEPTVGFEEFSASCYTPAYSQFYSEDVPSGKAVAIQAKVIAPCTLEDGSIYYAVYQDSDKENCCVIKYTPASDEEVKECQNGDIIYAYGVFRGFLDFGEAVGFEDYVPMVETYYIVKSKISG